MNESKRYICFNLGIEEFAIPLLSVREVLAVPEVTPVPQMPSHFMGIMNLRGRVISVIDLRLKLGIKSAPSEENTVIILEIGDSDIGMLVDKVNSVQEMSGENLADKPSLENSKANEYVNGVFKRENSLVLLLDVARALSIEDKKVASVARAA